MRSAGHKASHNAPFLQPTFSFCLVPVLSSAKCSHMPSVSVVPPVRYCDFGLRSADKSLLGLHRRLR